MEVDNDTAHLIDGVKEVLDLSNVSDDDKDKYMSVIRDRSKDAIKSEITKLVLPKEFKCDPAVYDVPEIRVADVHKLIDSFTMDREAMSKLNILKDIKYHESAGMVFAKSCMNAYEDMHGGISENNIKILVGLIDDGMFMKYDQIYIYSILSGYWLPLRSPEGYRYIANQLGFDNVTVNYDVAVMPYVKFLEQKAPRVIIPRNTISVGPTRYTITTDGNLIRPSPTKCIDDMYKKLSKYKEERLTFPFRSIDTNAAPMLVINKHNCRIDNDICKIVGRDNANTIKWNIGNSLLDIQSSKRALLFYGEGGTGKSSLINKLLWILGDMSTTMSKDYLGEGKGMTDEELEKYAGSRFVTYGDVELTEGKMHNGLFKTLTSGDTISVKKMPMRIAATVILASNDLLGTHAMYRQLWVTRRLVVIPLFKREIHTSVLGNTYEEAERIAYLIRCASYRIENEHMEISVVPALLSLWGKCAPIMTRGLGRGYIQCMNLISTMDGITRNVLHTIDNYIPSKPLAPANIKLSATSSCSIIQKPWFVIENDSSYDQPRVYVYDASVYDVLVDIPDEHSHIYSVIDMTKDTSDAMVDYNSDTYSGCSSMGTASSTPSRARTLYSTKSPTHALRDIIMSDRTMEKCQISAHGLSVYIQIASQLYEYVDRSGNGKTINRITKSMILNISHLLDRCDYTSIVAAISSNNWTGLDVESTEVVYYMAKTLLEGVNVSINGIGRCDEKFNAMPFNRYIISLIAMQCLHIRSKTCVEIIASRARSISPRLLYVTSICDMPIHIPVISNMTLDSTTSHKLNFLLNASKPHIINAWHTMMTAIRKMKH